MSHLFSHTSWYFTTWANFANLAELILTELILQLTSKKQQFISNKNMDFKHLANNQIKKNKEITIKEYGKLLKKEKKNEITYYF